MLDQSLASQMQVVQDADSAKLRAKCTPPPGKHHMFGVARAGDGETQDVREAREAQEAESSKEIFDDGEFYVQLLREVLVVVAALQPPLAAQRRFRPSCRADVLQSGRPRSNGTPPKAARCAISR